MKRILSLLFAIFACAVLLHGCESTTAGGATGPGRSQFLLISSEAVNEGAAKAYRQEMAKARSVNALNTNATETRRVSAITHRLIAQVGVFRADALDWAWEINVIEDKSINAYCMPGGKMVIYTGIINELNLTDDELAAIIGHEMAHALREHSREQISQRLATTGAVSIGAALLGLGSATQDMATLASDLVLTLPFSRSMEIEADTMGMELMARAGFDPAGAVRVWQKMAALSGGKSPTTFLSTHPSDSARITNLQNQLPKVIPLFEEAKRSGISSQAQSTVPRLAAPARATSARTTPARSVPARARRN